MAIKLGFAVAMLALAAGPALAGSQSSNTSSNSSSNNGVVRERIVDSYCEDGYCERTVFRQVYRDDNRRAYRQNRWRGERAERRRYRDRGDDD